ncbi:MAG: PEPxxWA-CTERM sorting domain-containing protein [Betaproteobacteria bacterium]|nr:PEPxxWA-CTERM sorting domain-containing protein [Betaproteobacteria bacterium]
MSFRTKLIAVFASSLVSSPALALDIIFEYDSSSGFYTQERRDAIERAASHYENYIMDDVNVFVSMESVPGNVLFMAQAIPATHSADFQNDWRGTIVFNESPRWYSGIDESAVDNYDLFSTALHELGHILGVGPADTWLAQISNGYFYGENAVSVYGGAVPLGGRNDHWAEGVESTLPSTEIWQLAVFEAYGYYYPDVRRQYLTDLDLAGLADIGWTISSIPEPETWAMLLAGLGVVGVTARRRRRQK